MFYFAKLFQYLLLFNIKLLWWYIIYLICVHTAKMLQVHLAELKLFSDLIKLESVLGYSINPELNPLLSKLDNIILNLRQTKHFGKYLTLEICSKNIILQIQHFTSTCWVSFLSSALHLLRQSSNCSPSCLEFDLAVGSICDVK